MSRWRTHFYIDRIPILDCTKKLEIESVLSYSLETLFDWNMPRNTVKTNKSTKEKKGTNTGGDPFSGLDNPEYAFNVEEVTKTGKRHPLLNIAHQSKVGRRKTFFPLEVDFRL